MQHEADGEPYTGSFVVLRLEPEGFTVLIEPRLPTDEGGPCHFAFKSDAWSAAQHLWTSHRLPFLDFTAKNIGREERE